MSADDTDDDDDNLKGVRDQMPLDKNEDIKEQTR